MSFQCIFTTNDGTRLAYPPSDRVISVECRYEADGGMTEGTVEVNCTLAESQRIVSGSQVNVYNRGVHIWRGYIEDFDFTTAEDRRVTLKCYGIWVFALRRTAQQKYFRAGGVDAGLFFSDICNRWIVPLYPELRIYSDTTGVCKTTEDAYGKQVKEVFARLREWTAGEIVFGGDVVRELVDVNYGGNRLFLRNCDPVGAPSIKFVIPSEKIGEVKRSSRTSSVINAAYLLGGDRAYPNVFPSDMETPREKTPSDGNLLINAGFDVNDFGGIPVGWTLYGGADDKTGGLSEGPTIGRRSIETDDVGEGAEQEITGLSDGRRYQFGGQVRQLLSADTNVGKFDLEFYDVSDVLLGTATLTVQPGDVNWERHLATVTSPTGTDYAIFRLEQTVKATDGLFWDECEVLDITDSFVDGVELIANGTAEIVSQEAARETTAPYLGVGGYVYWMEVTASDSDSNDVRLQPLNLKKAECLPNQSWDFLVPARLPVGAPASPKLRLVMLFYDKDGNLEETQTTDIPAASLTTNFSLLTQTETSPSNAAFVTAYVAVRGNGTLEFDAFCLRPTAGGGGWVAVGPYQKLWRASEMSGLPSEIQDSESLYGYREPSDALSVPEITSDDDAEPYMERYFAENALPKDAITLEFRDPDILIMPGQRIEATGRDGQSIFPTPQRYENGTLKWPVGEGSLPVLSMSLAEPERDPVRMLLKRQRQIAQSVARQSQSGNYSSGSGGGVSVGTQVSSLDGDVTGALDATTVEKIQGVDVAATAPTDTQVLAYSAANSRWEPTAPGGSSLTITKVTLTHSDLDGFAAPTWGLTLFSLPAGHVVLAVKVKHSTAFSGGGATSATVSVGTVSAPTKYTAAFNIFQAAGATVYQVANTIGGESHSAGTNLVASFSVGSANVEDLTAGSVTIWVLHAPMV